MHRTELRPRKRRRSLPVRIVRLVLLAMLSLYGAYLVAANVFLSTSLFERYANSNPERLDIRFERAWTLFPQHVHARKLTIRGRDNHNEWWLRFERAEFDLSLSSLKLRRTFEASHLRGDGVVFRFRRRPEVAPSEADLATLPAIPGFAAYTLRPPPPPPAPPGAPPEPYRKITLHLEDLALEDVREVWVQHVRFAGSARVAGRFYFKPKREIEVGPVRVALWSGGLWDRGRPVAESFGGSSFDLTMARYNLQTGTTEQFLAGLGLATDVHAIVPNAARVPGLAANEGPLEIRDGRVRIAHGRFEDGSQLLAVAPAFIMTKPKHLIDGTMILRANVARGADGRDRLAVEAQLLNTTVRQRDGPRPVLHASDVMITADATALELSRPFADLHVVVDVDDGKMPNAGTLSRYIPLNTPAGLERGLAHVQLHFEAWLADKRGTARALVLSDHLDFRLARMRVRGRAAVLVNVGTIRFDTRRLEDAALTVQITDGTLCSTRAPDRSLARLNTAEIAARGSSVDLADPLRNLDVAIAAPSAEVVSGSLLQAYLPKGSEMKIVTAGSRYELGIDLAIRNHLARGTFRLQSKAFHLALREFRLRGHLGVHAVVRNWNWVNGNLTLERARVEIDHVAMTTPGSSTTGMTIGSIGIVARSNRFQLGDPLASVHLQAWFEDARVRDAATANAFLAKGSTFRFEGNEGSFDARLALEVSNHVAKGSLRASMSRFGVAGRVIHLHSDNQLAADFVDWNFKERTVKLKDAHVELAKVSGHVGPVGERPEFSVGRLHLTLQSPLFDLAHPRMRGSDFRLVIEDGKLPDARALAPLLPPKRALDIEAGVAHIEGDFRVSHTRGTAGGNLDVALERARLRLREVRALGDFRFRLQLVAFDPPRRLLNISGTRLQMRNITLTGATARTTNWQGDVEFAHAWLRLRPYMSLDSFIRLEASDAKALLAILFEHNLPKVVRRLTDVPHLSASARLVAGPHMLGLFDLEAKGGDLSVRGSYAARAGEKRGALVVKKAFISLGVRVDNRGVHPRFFRLNRWLQARSCGVAALLALKRPGC